MKIILLGNFGSGNVGNEASLSAVRSALEGQFAEVSFLCASSHPEQAAATHGIDAVPLRPPRGQPGPAWKRYLSKVPRALGDLVAAVSTVRSADAVVVPGTGILDDFGDVPTGMPYDLLVWSLAARVAGRPLYLLAVGAGPIQHRRSRMMLKMATRLATTRSFRDAGSRHYMGTVGVDVGNDRVVPDVLFASTPLGQSSRRPGEGSGEGNIVGVGIMHYRGWSPHHPHADWIEADYLRRSADLIERLIGQGCQVVVLAAEAADQAAGSRCLALVDPQLASAARLVPTPGDVNELAELLGDADVVVAARFHMVLTALTLGLPVVSVGYAPRNRELMADAGLAEFAHDIERFEPATVARQVAELLARHPQIKERLDAWTETKRSLLSDEIRRATEVIGDRKR